MDDSHPFAEPKRGLRLEDCAFYHRLDIPGVRDRQDLPWDFTGEEAEYLANFDFSGKRVLEFGAASGGLTFWMEKQGAEVVAVDLSPDAGQTSWDILLPPGEDIETVRKRMAAGIARLNNGFWYAHEYFRSRARMVHATAYNVPRGIGKFDVITLCAILPHLRDPIGALEHAIEFTEDAVVISDLAPVNLSREERWRPLADFFPSRRVAPHGGVTWWQMSPWVYRVYLEARGFEVADPIYRWFRHQLGLRECFQLVARRSRG